MLQPDLPARRFGPVRVSRHFVAVLIAAVLSSGGCTAFCPMHGVNVADLPPEVRLPRRTGLATIDLSLLRQTPPPEHLVDGGDVLGVYVEGILGRDGDVPPIYNPTDRLRPPSIGYPITVHADGTISLPQIPPLMVRGLSVPQVEQAVRQAYTEGPRPLIKPDFARVLVSMQQPRVYKVLVIRQEASNPLGIEGASEVETPLLQQKHGTGRVVHLPAYQNDVLHALAQTGGPPGLDAENAVYVIRGRCVLPPGAIETMDRLPLDFGFPPPPAPALGAHGHSLPMQPPPPSVSGSPIPPPVPGLAPEGLGPEHLFPLDFAGGDLTMYNSNVIRIPLRVPPGELPQHTEQDITLHDGDIVFVESREREFFYTAGLLGGGQFTLPRDYDLNVLDAIALSDARRRPERGTSRAIGGISSLNQDVTVGASQVIILRKQPDGTQLPIEIDLRQALVNPNYQIIIQPEDRIVLRYTCPQAILAFFERHLLEGYLIGAATTLLYRR